MAARPLPPLDFLRECFSFDPGEGIVRWRERPLVHFANERDWRWWNGMFAGTEGSAKAGYPTFRMQIGGLNWCVRAHRIAYALHHGTTEFGELDHVNGDRTDNRIANIRPASRSQNAANRDGWSKLGLPKGVRTSHGRFVAQAAAEGGRILNLGSFSSPAAAHAAYCAYAKARFGEFFNPGPPKPSVFD